MEHRNTKDGFIRSAVSKVSAADRGVLLWVSRQEHGFLTLMMRALSGIAGTRIVLLLLLGLFLQSKTVAGLVFCSTMLALIIIQSLKILCKRPRPSNEGFVPLEGNPDAFSMPSGHTGSGFAIATTLTVVQPEAWPIFVFFAAGIAFSRVYLRVHYPSDTVIGAGIGISASAITVMLSQMFWPTLAIFIGPVFSDNFLR